MSTMKRLPGEPVNCRCTRLIVDTLEETLDCGADWRYVAEIGKWVHCW